MIRSPFERAWRAQTRAKKLFYATYMKWLVRFGYATVILLLLGAGAAFVYKIDDVIKADNVEIVPEFSEIKAAKQSAIVKPLIATGTAVSPGDELFQIAEDSEIEQYFADRALSKSVGNGRAVPGVSWQKPNLKTVVASVSGILIYEDDNPYKIYEPEAALAKIENPERWIAIATLKGESAPNAAVGKKAVLSHLLVDSESKTTVRIELAGPNSASVVGRNVSQNLRGELNTLLDGKRLIVPRDSPLSIREVTDVEVDIVASGHRSSGLGGDKERPILMDFSPDLQLTGVVESGEHILTAQIADLPHDVRRHADAMLTNSLEGKRIGAPTANGVDPFDISDMREFKYILKVKASEQSGTSPLKPDPKGDEIRGVSLERAYKATIRLEGLTESLKKQLFAMHRSRKITARVEVITGQKPIALILLKRS